MVDINWDLLGQPADVFGHFQQGYNAAKTAREQQYQGSVLSALVKNPSDTGAFNALAGANPELAMQYQSNQASQAERQRKAQQDAIEANRENIIRGAQIVRQVQPKDQASWDQALSLAQQTGIDVTHVPRDWNDPQTQQYAQGLTHLADTFEPMKPEQSPFTVVPYQQGGGALKVDKRTGVATELVRPDGLAPPAAPSHPHVMTDAEMRALEQGGQTPTASGTFRP